MRPFAAYAAAGATGLGVAVFVLWLARSTAVGADPVIVSIAVVAVLGILAAVLTRLAPAQWVGLALVISAPLALLGIAMFAALANIGEFFWIWLGVGFGAVAAALLAAYFAGRRR